MLGSQRWRRSLTVAALLGAFALVPHDAAAASCSGQSHAVVLSGGAVTPGVGSTSTTFRFSVTYSDNAGCQPDTIEVVIGGVGRFALQQTGGDLTTGATFAHDMTLPAGAWTYAFETTSGSGPGLETFTLTGVNPAKAVVANPTPKPTPTPTPTQKPTPTPRATPTPPPTPRVGPTATPGPSPSSSIGPSTDPSSSPSPGASAPAPTTAATPQPSAAPAGVVATRPPSGHDGSGVPSPFAGPFDLGAMPRPLLSLAVASVGTVIGLGFFLLLSVRLLDPGSSGRLRPVAAARRRSGAASRPLAPGTGTTGPDGSATPVIARVEAPSGGSLGRAALTFAAPAARGVDRCRVVSRMVPLRAVPDEPWQPGSERLDVGDEVDVVRQQGPYCYVRTPSGAEGWVPGLALTSIPPRAVEDRTDGR
ncbi:MAG TPA: hypothetical protein VFX65_00735 [Candidatus Limnocylindrales bacterium]|nr:hypothetical protein [Candidatus Limnocylindrales bacterium]